ncbi:hypothetical protein MRX96_027448 [Rhipicephalus microplus]
MHVHDFRWPLGEAASSGTKGTPLCLALQWRPQQNGSDLHWAWKPCDHSGRYICQKKAFTDCLYDYIEIESPHTRADPVRICGQHETDLDRFDHFSESNELRLTFHSDYSVTATGFAASWTTVDMASLCHDPPSTLTAYKDRPQSLVSPHYPLFYPNSMHCRYVIKSETPSLPVLVTVEDLDVGVRDASGLCLGDRVSVRLSATTAVGSPATISLCGGDQSVQRGFQLLSYGDTLKLTLEAQPQRTRRHRGFNITYNALIPINIHAVRAFLYRHYCAAKLTYAYCGVNCSVDSLSGDHPEAAGSFSGPWCRASITRTSRRRVRPTACAYWRRWDSGSSCAS